MMILLDRGKVPFPLYFFSGVGGSFGKIKEWGEFMYLLNPTKRKSVAHLWTGTDTVCRMYSTKGLKEERQELTETTLGKRICTMCAIVKRKTQGSKTLPIRIP